MTKKSQLRRPSNLIVVRIGLYCTCMSHACCMPATCLLRARHMLVACTSHACCMHVTCLLHACHMPVACTSHACYRHITACRVCLMILFFIASVPHFGSNVNRLSYQSLTADPDYQSLSFEELRFGELSRTARAARTTAAATAGVEESGTDLLSASRLAVLDCFLTCDPVRDVTMKLVRKTFMYS